MSRETHLPKLLAVDWDVRQPLHLLHTAWIVQCRVTQGTIWWPNEVNQVCMFSTAGSWLRH